MQRVAGGEDVKKACCPTHSKSVLGSSQEKSYAWTKIDSYAEWLVQCVPETSASIFSDVPNLDMSWAMTTTPIGKCGTIYYLQNVLAS